MKESLGDLHNTLGELQKISSNSYIESRLLSESCALKSSYILYEETYLKIQKILSSQNVPFALGYGSLLTITRDGYFDPETMDIDIVISHQYAWDLLEFFRRETKAKEEIRLYTYFGYEDKIINIIVIDVVNHICVDFSFLQEEGEDLYLYTDFWRDWTFKEDSFFYREDMDCPIYRASYASEGKFFKENIYKEPFMTLSLPSVSYPDYMRKYSPENLVKIEYPLPQNYEIFLKNHYGDYKVKRNRCSDFYIFKDKEEVDPSSQNEFKKEAYTRKKLSLIRETNIYLDFIEEKIHALPLSRKPIKL